MAKSVTEEGNSAEDLRVSAMIMWGLAPGLLGLGAILGLALDGKLFFILLGVSILISFIGAGLFAASFVLAKPPVPQRHALPDDHGSMLSGVVRSTVSQTRRPGGGS